MNRKPDLYRYARIEGYRIADASRGAVQGQIRQPQKIEVAVIEELENEDLCAVA